VSAEAYLICKADCTAYNLGKFVGTWTFVDWSRCTEAEFQQRIGEAWCGENDENLGITCGDGTSLPCDPSTTVEAEHAYARDLAHVLYRYCENHDWKVEVVHEDWFFDHEPRLSMPRPQHERLARQRKWESTIERARKTFQEKDVHGLAADVLGYGEPRYTLVGSRWRSDPPHGCGYDLPSQSGPLRWKEPL
jgi:hypothetical protein